MNGQESINWRGTASTAIAGLLITELPPITRAGMRQDRTEIDGRDGDIEEDLGYEAYKKTLQIGLTFGYDVDTVAKYFSGTGDLTLSNEPNKVYKASCKAAIDFEKLLRFKTAEVEFIVQPFKYLKDEAAVVQTITGGAPTSKVVTNQGLEVSKPLIKLEGSGIVTLTVAGLDVCTVNIDEGYVWLDSDIQEAYITGELKNQQMNGSFPTLQPGDNTIGWTGTLTKITVYPRSRWL